ncbi:hypothetical protein GEMRC1_001985 [Eukaryota sp. GEM-RC1]
MSFNILASTPFKSAENEESFADHAEEDTKSLGSPQLSVQFFQGLREMCAPIHQVQSFFQNCKDVSPSNAFIARRGSSTRSPYSSAPSSPRSRTSSRPNSNTNRGPSAPSSPKQTSKPNANTTRAPSPPVSPKQTSRPNSNTNRAPSPPVSPKQASKSNANTTRAPSPPVSPKQTSRPNSNTNRAPSPPVSPKQTSRPNSNINSPPSEPTTTEDSFVVIAAKSLISEAQNKQRLKEIASHAKRAPSLFHSCSSMFLTVYSTPLTLQSCQTM